MSKKIVFLIFVLLAVAIALTFPFFYASDMLSPDGKRIAFIVISSAECVAIILLSVTAYLSFRHKGTDKARGGK